eukprot:3569496-Pleurochrysis_carterae.AAC.1
MRFRLHLCRSPFLQRTLTRRLGGGDSGDGSTLLSERLVAHSLELLLQRRCPALRRRRRRLAPPSAFLRRRERPRRVRVRRAQRRALASKQRRLLRGERRLASATRTHGLCLHFGHGQVEKHAVQLARRPRRLLRHEPGVAFGRPGVRVSHRHFGLQRLVACGGESGDKVSDLALALALPRAHHATLALALLLALMLALALPLLLPLSLTLLLALPFELVLSLLLAHELALALFLQLALSLLLS